MRLLHAGHPADRQESCSNRTPIRRPTRSTKACRAISAVAPATTRSSRAFSGQRRGCAATPTTAPPPETFFGAPLPGGSETPGATMAEPVKPAATTGTSSRSMATRQGGAGSRGLISSSSASRFVASMARQSHRRNPLRRRPERLSAHGAPASGALDLPHARAHPFDRHLGGRQGPRRSRFLTGESMPQTFGILPVSQDEHALCVGKVRMVGDPVAAVAASHRRRGHRGRARPFDVDYEPLETISTIDEALAVSEPRIHDYSNEGGNVHKRVSMEFGDLEAASSEADDRPRGHLLLRGQHPSADGAALGCGGPRRRRRVTLYSSTQTPHYVHRALGPGARTATLAHPRHRLPQRRRLRRQERPVQPRDRRREDGSARSAGRSR